MYKPRPKRAQIRVLCTSPAPSDTRNPYVGLTVASVSEHALTTYFNWKFALFGKYDLVHAHWPESLGRGSTPLRQFLKQGLTLAFLARLRFSRVPVVRTLHNLQPHEDGTSRIDSFLISAFDTLTTQWIRLNQETPTPDLESTATIPHGLYPVEDAPSVVPEPGRVCFFGFIRPYKNVPSLVRAFSMSKDPTLRLTVMGDPIDESLREEVSSAFDGDERITLKLESIPQDQLYAAILGAELVVLPYLEMHNSGAALLALSLGRPVLVPDNSLNGALAKEVGESWVLRYDGDMSAEVIESAILTTRQNSLEQGPRLESRSWGQIGRRTLDVYARALEGAQSIERK